nr:thymidine phosphorylase [Brevirhabdus pacifica]
MKPEEAAWIAGALVADGPDRLSDAQAGAFAMAACIHGLGVPARVALTTAMRGTGKVLAWDLPGPVLDKHSTGGLGDCTSLVLAPALAACGAFVPMISGRGLGHTGGTLDKLEAIPGLNCDLDADSLAGLVRGAGCAIASAGPDIAPADRRLYAVRDLTSTVESVDLITASILSKKLAGGAETLILDVKTGTGAFLQDMEAARTLARALVETARGAGLNAGALLTDMNQPLATSLGNALEVMAAVECLTGSAEHPRLRELTIALGAELLVMAGLADAPTTGAGMIAGALDSGQAALHFARMVRGMGGPADFVERWRDRLPGAPVIVEVAATPGGDGAAVHVQAIDGRALGMAVIDLGGGRRHEDAAIDPTVGLSSLVSLGEAVAPGQPLARVHAADAASAARAAEQVRAAIALGPAPTGPGPLVMERIG